MDRGLLFGWEMKKIDWWVLILIIDMGEERLVFLWIF